MLIKVKYKVIIKFFPVLLCIPKIGKIRNNEINEMKQPIATFVKLSKKDCFFLFAYFYLKITVLAPTPYKINCLGLVLFRNVLADFQFGLYLSAYRSTTQKILYKYVVLNTTLVLSKKPLSHLAYLQQQKNKSFYPYQY